MRYAQERRGQKLHLVNEIDEQVMSRALCGKTVGHWRATFNVPLGMACRNCTRVYFAANRTPRTYTIT